MAEDREFDFKGYWGAKVLRPYVEYSKRGTHYCIYCGSIADTREHIPSKAFLNKPLPSDLPTLPACRVCNNGFSQDELYAKTYIECAKSVVESSSFDITVTQPDDCNDVREAKNAVKEAFINGDFLEDKRIIRIIKKLAIGHIVYELLEGYNIDSFPFSDICTKYIFRCSVDEKIWSNLENIEPLDNDVLPEIGSRVFRNIYVSEIPFQSINGDSVLKKHLLFMDWTDIQDGVYRYIAFLKNNEIIVKMIFRDFVYAETIIRK